MPSSGLPIESFTNTAMTDKEAHEMYRHIERASDTAKSYGLFAEWLESFVGAYNATKDPHQAAEAGLIECDM